LPERSIQISILNDKRKVSCEANCGIDWSSPEAITLASQQIKERFDKETNLEYLELAHANTSVQKWENRIKTDNLALPLLIINGQLRISGPFDIRQLLDTIEAEIEIMD
jgi:disulfide oxidoreductase YuzD